MSKYENFVFYGTMRESVEALGKELGGRLLWSIMEYGTSGTYDDSDTIIKAVMLSIIPNIKSARTRYETAVENGKKGGRPCTVDKEKVQSLLEQGCTHKEIANELNCSIDTIKKISSGLKKCNKGKNLDKDIDKDIDKDMDKDIELNVSNNPNFLDSHITSTNSSLPSIELSIVNSHPNKEITLDNINLSTLETVIKLFKEGSNYSTISEQTNISKKNIFNIIQRYKENPNYIKEEISRLNRENVAHETEAREHFEENATLEEVFKYLTLHRYYSSINDTALNLTIPDEFGYRTYKCTNNMTYEEIKAELTSFCKTNNIVFRDDAYNNDSSELFY